MKRILILADAYTQPSYAPRLRYLCDYLIRQGHKIEVYTEKWTPLTFEHDYPIHEITFYYLGKPAWFIKSGYSLLTDWKERHFAKQVLKQTKGQSFDLVFCTTFSTFPLGAAVRVAEALHLPLHVDIRDINEQVPGNQYIHHTNWYFAPFRRWYNRVYTQRRNLALPKADCLTTVSPWHVDFLKAFNPNVHLVYNGYDPKIFYPKDVKNDVFRINYIGRIYRFQDPSLLSRALTELEPNDIQVNFYSNASASRYMKNRHFNLSGYIPSSAVSKVIQQSSILLVLSDAKARGMMTTKFFEALGCEKPVLCIPSDRGVLAQTIKETNAGLVSSDVEEIKAFILDKYNEWKQNGFTRQEVHGKEQYSRETEAQSMEELMIGLCR